MNNSKTSKNVTRTGRDRVEVVVGEVGEADRVVGARAEAVADAGGGDWDGHAATRALEKVREPVPIVHVGNAAMLPESGAAQWHSCCTSTAHSKYVLCLASSTSIIAAAAAAEVSGGRGRVKRPMWLLLLLLQLRGRADLRHLHLVTCSEHGEHTMRTGA